MDRQTTPPHDHLRFPIGPLSIKENYSLDEIDKMIGDIEKAPSGFASLQENLSKDDLEKTYRPGSWNVRQLIHHVADIQLLHFLRMKKALTEPEGNTTIINMDGWAGTPDSTSAPVDSSVQMLGSTTKRYVYLMRSLSSEQLQIKYFHAARNYYITQAQAIAMSAWHLRHHFAHIQIALSQRTHYE